MKDRKRQKGGCDGKGMAGRARPVSFPEMRSGITSVMHPACMACFSVAIAVCFFKSKFRRPVGQKMPADSVFL